ncbi:hypothetical protein, partial [Neomoorella thermoacetica]|uniref:hypothetical protein n=1 Tax=Neomoorella thermoacetica TaxID=1525 RepID=UPI001C4322CF
PVSTGKKTPPPPPEEDYGIDGNKRHILISYMFFVFTSLYIPDILQIPANFFLFAGMKISLSHLQSFRVS